MENNYTLKKYLVLSLVIILLFLTLLWSLSEKLNTAYNQNINYALNGIIEELLEKYPDLEKQEIVKVLNNNKFSKNEILKEYGISLEKDALVYGNLQIFQDYQIMLIILSFLLGLIIIFLFLLYNQRKNKEINEITEYIKEINRKNYKLDIDSNTEEELSILKNELYKITIMLKEQAENSIQDKIKLKNSLEDISHQLKTPLTSINIMLDNILEDEGMERETRKEFIKDIQREIKNINFLVLSLLKLSKFDANTISFDNQKFKIHTLIKEVIANVEILSDIKNIHINITGGFDASVTGDFAWQKEALTNILKNCIEHSNNDSQIDICYEENKIYSKIMITDYGIGINKEDLPHIFERFYKGENSSRDSIGIGLALAKSIIKKNNGEITAISKKEVGTTFTIKYFK